MDLLIHNGIIITMNEKREIIRNGALVIKGDRILAIGGSEDILRSYPDMHRMDASGKALMPGLINLHTHLILTVLRGVAEDAGKKALYGQMNPMMRLMGEEDFYTMAKLGCLEAIRSGTTCLVENSRGAQSAAKAIEETGVRAAISQIVNDADLAQLRSGTYHFDPTIGERLLQQSIDFVEKWHRKDNNRILGQLSPHAPDTCSSRLLKEIRNLAEKYDLKTHIHLAQTEAEVDQVLKREGKRSVEYLESVGLLGPGLIAGHCVFIDEKEIERLGKTRTNVSHNAAINARRGKIAPICDLREAGANIGLGSDNMSEDMFEVLRVAVMVGRIKMKDGTALLPDDVIEMGTLNGAKALGLEREIGSLEAGKKADVILIDLRKPHLVPLINVVPNIVHAGLASDVETVIIDGHMIMEERQIKTANEAEVMERAQKTTESLWEKFHQVMGY